VLEGARWAKAAEITVWMASREILDLDKNDRAFGHKEVQYGSRGCGRGGEKLYEELLNVESIPSRRTRKKWLPKCGVRI
jgi:FlaA1/EpsC-like NDP-sugar epimerase